jgi:hypothetical protein
MKHKKLASVLALVVSAGAALSVAVAGSSDAAAPYGGNITFTYAPIGSNPTSDAYSYAASGLLNISPGIHSTCTANTHTAKYGLAVLLPPLLTVSAPNTGCTFAGGEGTTNSRIAEASLLNGLVKVDGVDSECGVSPLGTGFAGSRLAYLNGVAIGSGYGRLILPDLLEVQYNDSEVLPNGTLVNYALKITVGKTLVILGHTYTIGQEITLGECSVSPA